MRSHFRVHARHPLSLGVTVRSGGRTLQGRVLDLGLGGAGLYLREALEEGLRVSLSVDAPTRWDPLELEAVVRWAAPDGDGDGVRVGTRFDHRSSRTLTWLVELLATAEYR